MFFQFTSTANLLARDLNRLASAIPAGRRGLLERVVDEVARPSIAANFEASGRPPWEELADSTVERRERRERQGVGTRPLIASGGGMAQALDRDRWAISRDRAEYHAPPGPIRFHQEGAEDGHFPARPYVHLTEEDAQRLDAVGLSWLDGRLRVGGF